MCARSRADDGSASVGPRPRPHAAEIPPYRAVADRDTIESVSLPTETFDDLLGGFEFHEELDTAPERAEWFDSGFWAQIVYPNPTAPILTG
jgi:hypothetical protein